MKDVKIILRGSMCKDRKYVCISIVHNTKFSLCKSHLKPKLVFMYMIGYIKVKSFIYYHSEIYFQVYNVNIIMYYTLYIIIKLYKILE